MNLLEKGEQKVFSTFIANTVNIYLNYILENLKSRFTRNTIYY